MKKQIKVAGVSVASDDVSFIGEEGDVVLTLKRTDPRVEDMVQQVVKGSLLGSITIVNYSEETKTSLDKVTKATKNLIRFFQSNGTKEKAVKSKIDKGFKLGMYVGKTKYTDCSGLISLFNWAVKCDMLDGLVKFLERTNAVITEREHSVVDMIAFMSTTNLPITKEGNILAFKAVKTKSNGVFTDIHTGLVNQSVGSVVQMDASLVDLDRLNHCSDGLHIASQNYLSGFRGDDLLIVCIHPEDVYAVPTDTTYKMRVRAYQIVSAVSRDMYARILSGNTLDSTTKGAKLLAELVAENFPPVNQIVDIGGQRGTKLTYTKVAVQAKKRTKSKPVKTLKETKEITAEAPKLVKADIVKQANKSRKEIASDYVVAMVKAKSKKKKAEILEELKAFKKKCKVSWESLGIDESIIK